MQRTAQKESAGRAFSYRHKTHWLQETVDIVNTFLVMQAALCGLLKPLKNSNYKKYHRNTEYGQEASQILMITPLK